MIENNVRHQRTFFGLFRGHRHSKTQKSETRHFQNGCEHCVSIFFTVVVFQTPSPTTMALRGRGQNQRHTEIKSVLSDDESVDLFSGNDLNNDRLLDNLLRSHQTGGAGSGYSKWNSGTKEESLMSSLGLSNANGKTSTEPLTRSDAWMPTMASPSAYESPRRTKPAASIRTRTLFDQDDFASSPQIERKILESPPKLSKDSHLPLDQVIIFPNSPTTPAAPTGSTISRLRRQYRSGARSVTDSGDASISQPPLGGHVREGLDVNSILLSLGLNSDKADSVKSERDGLLSQKSRSDSISRRKQHHRPSIVHLNIKNPLHVRAIFVLCVMAAALYTLIQETAVVSEHSNALRKMALRRKRHFLRHEEGVDRPIVDQRVLDHLNKFRKPNAIELMHVHGKVQTKHHGPETFRDKPNYGDDAVKSEAKAPTDNLEENPTDTDVGEKFANVLSQSTQRKEEEPGSEGDEQEPPVAMGGNQEPPSDALPPVHEEEIKTVAKAVENILAETSEPRANDIPFLWIIPRSGSAIVKNVASQCLGLTLASEAGGSDPNADRKSLQIIDLGGNKFLNVNLATVPGIVEARNLHLSASGLVDLVVSARFPEAATLFDPAHKGRVVALFRHPVERLISMFYHLKKHNVPVVAKLSIEEYAKSPHVENNWMTRMLSGKMTGEVGDFELGVAKRILQSKVLVGLLEQKDLSMRRFEYYLGWNYTQDAIRQGACRKRILTGDYRTNEISSHRVKEGSQAWSLLLWQNKLDLKLYKYAKALFLQQGAELFSDMPES
jgi:hypothetical protein